MTVTRYLDLHAAMEYTDRRIREYQFWKVLTDMFPKLPSYEQRRRIVIANFNRRYRPV